MKETINRDELINFFSKLSKTWQYHIDYNFFKDIELSSEQIKIIDQDEEQMLINGYAGTGKSITLLYKFINTIMREVEHKRILYISYNNILISDTRKRLRESDAYMNNYKRHDVQVCTYHEMAYKLLKSIGIIEKNKSLKLTQDEIIKNDDISLRRIAVIVEKYRNESSEEYKKIPNDEKLFNTHNEYFVKEEIRWMKENGFITKDEYMNVERKGRSRSIRLTKKQRNTIFKIFQEYNHKLKVDFYNHLDLEDYALEIIKNFRWIDEDFKYDYIFVDEVQDLQPMQIKTLVMLTKKSLVISGDPRQTIHRRSPYSYDKLGINLNEKGRIKLLNKNYRCSAEIMRLASSLNFDNGEFREDRTNFVRSGDKPIIIRCKDENSEIEYVINQIKEIFDNNPNQSVAIIHRDEDDASRGNYVGNKLQKLKENFFISSTSNYASKFDRNKPKQILYTSAYDVKGLEFDYVFLIQFNNHHYPQKYKLDELLKNNEADESILKDDIDEVINIEKKILYVAMTRAKKNLYMTYSGNISEFYKDFDKEDYKLEDYSDR